MPETFSIHVPATVGHLGPGFGVLGLAIDLVARLDVVLEDTKKGGGDLDSIRIERHEHEGVEVPRTLDIRHDAVLRGLQLGLAARGRQLPASMELALTTGFPHGVGLGSTTAEYVLGLAAAREVLVRGETRKAAAGAESDEDALEAAQLDREIGHLVQLGGDPGHGAAALGGGLCAAVPLSGGGRHEQDAEPAPGGSSRNFRLLRLPLAPGWFCALAIPEIRYGAADVHRILPPTLPNMVTQRTVGRLAGVLTAFARGDTDLLRASVIDEIHVPPRKKLTVGIGDAMDAAEEAGAAAVTIAGHGPALVAWTRDSETAEVVAAAMQEVFVRHGVECGSHVCAPSVHGAGVVEDDAGEDGKAVPQAEGGSSPRT